MRQQGQDRGFKLAEIGVGEEPRCAAIHPNDQVAYVTNGIGGTVSAVSLAQRRVVAGTSNRFGTMVPRIKKERSTMLRKKS
jgi:DNA-binding beta-propeller fold protein YncE